MRNFRELEVWKIGMELSVSIYKLGSLFPKNETYSLQSQVQRSAASIPANIAEGCSRSSNKEFIRFLEIALGSAFELETHLMIIREIQLFETDFEALISKIHELQSKLNAFRNSVKKFDQ
ncbi:MAG: four helix bundle protein [Cyclobacteriaceae bacterium]